MSSTTSSEYDSDSDWESDTSLTSIIRNRLDYLYELNTFINSRIVSIVPIVITERNIFRYINMLPRDEHEIISILFERKEGEPHTNTYNSTT
jgi:hypothetical protein